MQQRDIQRVQRILEYCTDVSDTVERFGNDFQSFSSDKAYQQTVSFCILQIGELSNSLTDEFKAEYEGLVNWRQIRGMRNIVVHDYGKINLEVLWDAAVNDIPNLAEFCRSILK